MNEAFLLIGAFVAALYFVLGFGVTRLVAKANDRGISLSDVLLWPMLLVIWAICGNSR